MQPDAWHTNAIGYLDLGRAKLLFGRKLDSRRDLDTLVGTIRQYRDVAAQPSARVRGCRVAGTWVL